MAERRGIHTACADRMCDDCTRDLQALEAALREAEAQRDEAVKHQFDMYREFGKWSLGVQKNLRAAERKVDEWREAFGGWSADQALDAYISLQAICRDAQGKVDEYRQRAEALAEGWRWRKVAVEKEDDIALDMAEAQLDAAARDALRVEQPRQEAMQAQLQRWPDLEHLRDSVAEPER